MLNNDGSVVHLKAAGIHEDTLLTIYLDLVRVQDPIENDWAMIGLGDLVKAKVIIYFDASVVRYSLCVHSLDRRAVITQMDKQTLEVSEW